MAIPLAVQLYGREEAFQCLLIIYILRLGGQLYAREEVLNAYLPEIYTASWRSTVLIERERWMWEDEDEE